MYRNKLFALLAVTLVLALALSACGSKQTPANTPAADGPAAAAPAEVPGLTEWSLDASIWSSYNGATVTLTAAPTAYTDGQSASFVVRLEGEDVVNVPCEWDGKHYTAFAELNAADGYCYYVTLVSADGTQTTVDVNTPTSPYDMTLISMAASLESHCSTLVNAADFADGTLTITDGIVQIQPPQITSAGEHITCTGATLILNLDEDVLDQAELTLPEAENGVYAINLAGTTFQVPAMDAEHRLSLVLQVNLSNGDTLTDSSSNTWFYSDGELHLTVG